MFDLTILLNALFRSIPGRKERPIPEDVVLQIKQYLTLDLSLHACLSQACRAVRSLYDEKEDEFWR